MLDPFQSHIDDAYEVFVGGDGSASVLLTCEHASNRIPLPWRWPDADQWLQPMHWSFDIGAAEITRRLAAELGAVAILARFTRLLVDPNRTLEASTLFRDRADGRPITLNTGLRDDEKGSRIETLYQPYHRVIDHVMSGRKPGILLAMHSFTPVYEGGETRSTQLGVLFDLDEPEAVRLELAFRETGLVTALNQPYSGANGMMFSAQSHADRHGWKALELEICQDLSGDPAQLDRLVRVIAAGLVAANLV